MRKLILLLLAAALTAGCSGGPPTYRTPEAAFQAMFPDQTPAIVQELPMEQGKVILFRSNHRPEIQVTSVEYRQPAKWRFQGYGIGSHRKTGPLSFDQADQGTIEEKLPSGATHISAKVRVFYGEVFDPRITWVEVSIPEEPQSRRAQVINGTWAVTFPNPGLYRAVSLLKLRAGDQSGELWRDDDPFH